MATPAWERRAPIRPGQVHPGDLARGGAPLPRVSSRPVDPAADPEPDARQLGRLTALRRHVPSGFLLATPIWTGDGWSLGCHASGDPLHGVDVWDTDLDRAIDALAEKIEAVAAQA
ncbi:MAG TPA: hypothetical protein VFR93_08740 [Candidatus Limnocylindrales bacterium]|nr:hypothetical protein [Candidatus Limnocylindrales bacterium]